MITTHRFSGDFLSFLADRLTEEVVIAERRRQTMAEPSRAVSEGLRFLDQLVLGLAEGRAPDDTSLAILMAYYGRHPDFRPEWRQIAC